jgi:Transposase DDE domain
MKRERGRVGRRAPQDRHRRPRPGVPYAPWRQFTRNQEEVARRLTAGQITGVTVTGWSYAAQFLSFLDLVGYCALLNLEGQGFVRVMIPIAQLVLTYQLKVRLGIGSINLVPTRLFREWALLQLIGYTTTQLQSGFCQRGHLTQGPMHQNTLADAIERLQPAELERLLNATVQRLRARGCFRTSRGHYALDASDLPTTPRYTGAGVKSYLARRVTKEKQVVEVTRRVWGFKVLIVDEVQLRLVVAAKGVPIQEHESRYTRALVPQAVTNLGTGALQVLLIDRGFRDGADLWYLKETLGIDFVIPAKDNMAVTIDARALCRDRDPATGIVAQERAGWRRTRHGRVRWVGQVTVVAVPGLCSYDQYGDDAHARRAHRHDFVAHPLNAIVVTHWEGTAYPVGEEKVFLTSLPVTAPLAVLDLSDLRSLIENTAFRELKQGWGLLQYPKKTVAAVRGHVFVTLLTFTLANAFCTSAGHALTHHGIRRQRAEQYRPRVVLFAGDCYGIFDVEEVLILLGVVPAQCWQTDPVRVRHRYGLPASA